MQSKIGGSGYKLFIPPLFYYDYQKILSESIFYYYVKIGLFKDL